MTEHQQRCRLMMRELSRDIKKFEKLKTNVDRMDFVYDQVLRYGTYPSFHEDKKSDSVAIKNREQGNSFFKSRSYRKALDYYTMSLLHAESKEILALAYANRSAALSKLNLYQECLMDIDRPLKNNYPDNLKPKLLARQIHAKLQTIVVTKYYENIPSIPDFEKNPQIQCAKNCIKIVKNEQYGRHIVATRNIQIGEILAIESSPYSGIIKDQIYVHCHECFNLCYNLFPCEKCTKALYCTKECKDKAFTKHHKYECPILLSLDPVSTDPSQQLALRTLFCSRTEWDKENFDEVDTVYRSNRFKEIYNLENHVLKRGIELLLMSSAVACGLYILIKNHTTFFEDCKNEEKIKDVVLQLLLVCDTNLLNIFELTYLIIPERLATASAIYPFYALFNHSCCPSISLQSHGSTIILRARSSIKAGEQCFVNYGVHFAQNSRADRQMYLLENHFFSCTCRACVENWTVWDLMNIGLKWLNFQVLTMAKLVNADVSEARKELPQLIVEAEKAERSLPPGRAFFIQELVTVCYHILGNKRKI